MKALKIIAVVFGALLVLSGIGLLVGSGFTGAGQQAFNSELARQGFGGPVKGKVTAAELGSSPPYFNVEFTDADGDNRTGTGPVADGTRTPSVGDEVTVLYLLEDPDRIVIVNLGPAADFSTLGNALRIGGIVCIVLGALLLAAGIIGLVRGPKRPVPVAAAPGAYPPGPQPQQVPGPQPGPAPGQPQQGPPPSYQPAPPGPAEPPPEVGPPGPRPDYLSGPSGPPSSGGPTGQAPR